MKFDDVVYKRRSVRAYDANQKVTKEQILELVKCAQQAPSWKNSQTARYYAIFNPEKLIEVRQCLAPQNQIVTKDVNVLLVTTFVKNRSGFTREGNSENELGNGWGCYDLGLQNALLCLKATEMGLDTVILGLRDGDALRKTLDIPETEDIGAVIAVGYRGVSDVPVPKRKETEEILTYIG